jgi:D-alanyl-D-alanine carboxypeptidase (penicillin-binding protein 5/6)
VKYLLFGLLLTWQVALAEPNPFPDVARAYLVQVNGNTLWQKQADRRLPPASLTKLMTALLVIESLPLDSLVSISKAAAAETGSRLALEANSRFSVESLLKAALLQSANDACHALADHMAGSEPAFVSLMNLRAQKMGLTNTHFQNACGHDAENHYSSAEDLAKLANQALANPFIRTVASQPVATITSADKKYRYRLVNGNALVGRYAGVSGLKTGFTSKAGKCLIAYASREQKQVLLVMLNAPNRWWDAVDILDLAFKHASVK